MVPFLSNCYMLSMMRSSGMDTQVLYFFTCMQAVQTVITHILIFVSWKKGPQCWLNVAPGLYYVLLNVSYLVVPVIIAIYTDMKKQDIKDDSLYLQLFASLIIQIFHLLNYYISIHKLVLPEAKLYIKKRERKRILVEQGLI